MRDSALKLLRSVVISDLLWVGEELMRDSALKQGRTQRDNGAHRVGEELMRDSALKPACATMLMHALSLSEKSSCATAL